MWRSGGGRAAVDLTYGEKRGVGPEGEGLGGLDDGRAGDLEEDRTVCGGVHSELTGMNNEGGMRVLSPHEKKSR